MHRAGTAGFFYIRILLCLGIVSALAAALLGLGAPLLGSAGRIGDSESRALYCVNAIESVRAGLPADKSPAIIGTPMPGLGPYYRQISARKDGLTLETAIITTPPVKDEQPAQDSR